MRATKQEGRGGEIPGAKNSGPKAYGNGLPGRILAEADGRVVTLQTSTIFLKMVINGARKLSA